jgi:hypothetical protein
MTTETPSLPELLAAWRKTYNRTRFEMQSAGKPLLEWLCENGAVCAPWFAEDMAALAVADHVTHPEVLSVLEEIDRHFRGGEAAS